MPILRTHDYKLHLQAAGKTLPEAYQASFTEHRSTVLASLDALYAKLDRFRDGGHLTRQGAIQEARTAALAQQKENREQLAKIKEKLTSRIEDAKATATKREVKPENEVLRYLRHKDHREWMRGQDKIQHKAIIAEAIESGDMDFLDALAAAPRYQPVVDPSLLKAAQDRMVEAANPEVERLSELLRAYEYVYATAENAVKAGAEAFDVTDLSSTEPRLASAS